MSKLMPWATSLSPALGLFRAALAALIHALDYLVMALGQLKCDMSCIVNDNHSKKKIIYTT